MKPTQAWWFVTAYLRTRRHLRLGRPQLEKLQESLLQALVRKTLPRSPWLTSLLGSFPLRSRRDLDKFPVLDKKTVLAHFEQWNIFGISEQQALSGTDIPAGLSVGVSSGTTGRRGIFLTTPKERMQWAGTVLAKFLPGFWRQKHRIALFLRSNSPLYETLGSRLVDFRYFDLVQPVSELLADLETFQPTVLFAPPPVLEILAEAREQGTVTIVPTHVISGADVLEPSLKDRLDTVFGTTTKQIYQATEGFLAFSCDQGRLHLNEDAVYFRREELSGSGRWVPLITDLRRTTQPMVNYRLNDVLVDESAPCPCGCVFRVISSIEGREDDVLCLPRQDGGFLVPIFPDFVRRAVAEAAPRLEVFRVVQTDPHHVVVYLDEGRDEIRKGLQSLAAMRGLEPPLVEFRPYQELPLDRKRRRVSREFPLPPGFWENS